MKIENFISTRYIKDFKKNKEISSSSIIVIIVIAISIIFFISAISIMNGYIYGIMKIAFEIESFHIDYPINENFNNTQSKLNDIMNNKYIKDEILYADIYRETKVLLSANGKNAGLLHFRAMPEDIFNNDRKFNKSIKLLAGKKSIEYNEILISEKISEKLMLKIGDHVYLTALLVGDNPKITLKRLKISGIFTTGYVELDEQLTYIGKKTGDSIFQDSQGFNIFIKLKDYKKAHEISIIYNIPKKIDMDIFERYILKGKIRQINKSFILNSYEKNVTNSSYELKENLNLKALNRVWEILFNIGYISSFDGMITWEEKNHNILTALKFEKNIIAFIVLLVVFVATLNILTTIYITIHEKNQDIGILKAIGYSPRNINTIFLLNGIYLGFIGITIGIGLGLLIMNLLNEILIIISYIINMFQYLIYKITSSFINIDPPLPFVIFSKDFYLDKIYTSISFVEIIIISFLTMVFSILASIMPSLKAGKIKPIEVIKNG